VHMHAIYTIFYNCTEEMVKLSLINVPVMDFFEPVPELYGTEDDGLYRSPIIMCAPPHNERIAIVITIVIDNIICVQGT